MALAIIERSASGQITAVNPALITYLRQDAYGTTIHFTSGEHVSCALEMEALLPMLNTNTAEALLIQSA